MMPEAEIGELIVELRSATAGAGGFTRQFDRMAEVTGRAADQIIAAHRVAAWIDMCHSGARASANPGSMGEFRNINSSLSGVFTSGIAHWEITGTLSPRNV